MRMSSLSAAVAAFALFAAMPAVAHAAPLTVVVSASGADIAGPSAALGNYELIFGFDPSLTVQSVTFGSGLNLGDPFASLQFEDHGTAGNLDVLEVSFLEPAMLASLQPDAFMLFSVLFETGGLTPAAAFGSLDVQFALAGDTIGDFLDPSLFSITSPDVPALPEPSVMMVLGTGAAGLLARGWRRRNRR